MASGLHARSAMENEKNLLDEESATELPERDALSVIDPGRMGGALIPAVSPEPTVDQGMPETSTPS